MAAWGPQWRQRPWLVTPPPLGSAALCRQLLLFVAFSSNSGDGCKTVGGGTGKARGRGREHRTGQGTCISIRQSKSRLGCVPDFTSLKCIKGHFFSCLLAVSVFSPLPFPKSTSFLLLFTSARPCVTPFRLQLRFMFYVARVS